MNNGIVKQGLAVGIILLFVGTCIIPAIAQDTEKPLPTSRGNWLYVGGSGPGNYSKIQDAINTSIDGDTIYVYNDSSPYYEHLTINKSIRLVGEDRVSTVIDGSGVGTIVSITNNVNPSYVTLQSFTIRNGGEGINRESNAYKNNFSELTVENVTYGILIDYSWETNISHCTIVNSSYGIRIPWCFNTNISFCNFYNYQVGVFLVGNFVGIGQSNTLFGNSFLGGETGIWIGAVLDDNSLFNNVFHNNSYAGILLQGTQTNDVFNNHFSYNSIGVLLLSDLYGNADKNHIYGNNFSYNGIGISFWPEQEYPSSTIKRLASENSHPAARNWIFMNNFIGNDKHAVPIGRRNHWTDGKGHGNYWDDWIGLKYEACSKLPKIIIGRTHYLSLPRFNFDWHPAKEPYDIPGMR